MIAGVVRHLEQPGLEDGAGFHLSGVLGQENEDRLRDVLGEMLIAHAASGDAAHPVLVAVYQEGERLGRAGAELLQEFEIGHMQIFRVLHLYMMSMPGGGCYRTDFFACRPVALRVGSNLWNQGKFNAGRTAAPACEAKQGSMGCAAGNLVG